MKKLPIVLMALLICNSCKKNPSNFIITGTAPVFVSGEYTGSFERIYGDTGIAKPVSITFTSPAFTGNGDSTNYPAICSGSYTLPTDSIDFENHCAFPADFDWTYILKGKYSLTIVGDSLFISRTYGDLIYEADIYKLKRQ